MLTLGCGRVGRFIVLLLVPVVALSMGGCPQPVPPDDGGGGGNAPSCGNGTVETGEQCDDGNTVSGDGCSATCQTEEPPPPAPSDLDGDGIRDDIDECPGTARGTPVDANGCPADAPPGDTDTDGDGV
ncbi:MAG: DUF4215 domain-containing protein, partial [Phycisphaerales bacterium]|nr:DUF4215 domain-containing protein [Phycisphaerales bacterium]